MNYDHVRTWARFQREDRYGRKIVFTNGCYDILTAGHVKFLQWLQNEVEVRARRENWCNGWKLVIGLNTDESVRKLKGPGRPINRFENRASVLHAVRGVEVCFGFDEPTPDEIIKALKPDILAKGGDYKDEKIAGEDFVLSYGGIVLKSGTFEGPRTSDIAAAIRVLSMF